MSWGRNWRADDPWRLLRVEIWQREIERVRREREGVVPTEMSGLPTSYPRSNSEAGRNQAEAAEYKSAGGQEKGYLGTAVDVGMGVVGYGVEVGKWAWLKVREAAARVMRA